MNPNKFCFIICSNNDLQLNECIHYINHLTVPEGYELELLTITDASSITEAYNSAMETSDAKYKIYIHQDVFILNRNLLFDLLTVFQSDASIGMIGMVGYDTISSDGIMWHVPRMGDLYQSGKSYPPLEAYRFSPERDGISCAALIDGFFMATAYDLPWDTEDVKAFDFYDAYQSIAFWRHGYKVVVPTQRHPWCLHDDCRFLGLTNYNTYRQKFMKRYQSLLGKRYSQIPGSDA